MSGVQKFASDLWQDEAMRLEWLSYCLLFFALTAFISLQFVHATYGRYGNESNLGFRVPCRVAWFVQELPSFLVPVCLLIFTDCPQIRHWKNQIAIGMFLVHYFQRTFIFSLLIKGGKPTPVTTFLMAMSFCLFNGYLQGAHLLKQADLSHVPDVQIYTGVLLFLLGMFINIQSDHILRNLRKEGEKGYKIPYGGMYDYVSGANFFGESLEWIGFGVTCCTLPAIGFAIFTMSNVGPRACHHHKWYQEKFDDYPKSRKAYIPFIW